jgi:hypothetical protein
VLFVRLTDELAAKLDAYVAAKNTGWHTTSKNDVVVRMLENELRDVSLLEVAAPIVIPPLPFPPPRSLDAGASPRRSRSASKSRRRGDRDDLPTTRRRR